MSKKGLLPYITKCMDAKTANKVQEFMDDNGFELDDLKEDINDNDSKDDSAVFTEFGDKIYNVLKNYFSGNTNTMINTENKDDDEKKSGTIDISLNNTKRKPGIKTNNNDGNNSNNNGNKKAVKNVTKPRQKRHNIICLTDLIKIEDKSTLINHKKYKNFKEICKNCIGITSDKVSNLIPVLFNGYIKNQYMILNWWSDAYSRWKWYDVKHADTQQIGNFFIHVVQKDKRYKILQKAVDENTLRDIECLKKPQHKRKIINDSLPQFCEYYVNISNIIRELSTDDEYSKYLPLQIELIIIPMGETSDDDDTKTNKTSKTSGIFGKLFGSDVTKNVCKDIKKIDLYDELKKNKIPFEGPIVVDQDNYKNGKYIKKLKYLIGILLDSLRKVNYNRIEIVIDRRLYNKKGDQIDCGTMDYNTKYWSDIIYILAPPEKYRNLNKTVDPPVKDFPKIDINQFNKIYFDNIIQWILPKHHEMKTANKGAFICAYMYIYKIYNILYIQINLNMSLNTYIIK